MSPRWGYVGSLVHYTDETYTLCSAGAEKVRAGTRPAPTLGWNANIDMLCRDMNLDLRVLVSTSVIQLGLCWSIGALAVKRDAKGSP